MIRILVDIVYRNDIVPKNPVISSIFEDYFKGCVKSFPLTDTE